MHAMSTASSAFSPNGTSGVRRCGSGRRRLGPDRVQCSGAQPQRGTPQSRNAEDITRRALTFMPAISFGVLTALPALAFVRPPKGFRLHTDKLDGYSFFVPESWTQTTTSGNDVAYRDPGFIYFNLFVNVSSPSSSKYTSVTDLGSPADAGDKLLKQLLTEFMSTRLGVRREGEVVGASARESPDGKIYYDIQVRIQSYASRNQLAVSASDRDAAIEMEWDRLYTTVLGVANKRLYEFRIQSDATKDNQLIALMPSIESFKCTEV